ncbi:MAG: transketolase [Desulfovibrionaceae bacterium]|nr:transketolase [Desulfovibrionaceae bacterium]
MPVTRRQCANAIRALAIDAIEKANSGHPGAPLGMADMAEALWRHGLRHNPANPGWVNRDRFVLSNGHASMLIYALLHLTGYALTMDDIRNFRQLGSLTPGHPEYGHTPGVDITTGPLGSGIASAVGMALAEASLARKYNRPGHTIVDHMTYVFLGDGCLMEGVSHEACSLAGVWKLGKLVALYDDNGISIDGKVDGWFTEDVRARYLAYGWQVIGPVDGHDSDALDKALAAARADTERPSLIICRTHIGFGSARADSEKSHGAPLGEEIAAQAKQALGCAAEAFTVPADVAAAWDAREEGARLEAAWKEAFAAYEAAYPELAADFVRRMEGRLPEGADQALADFAAGVRESRPKLATRVASKNVLSALVPVIDDLIGGSADLSGSVGTKTPSSTMLDTATYEGNYICYGVREFGMGCIMNGLAVHGGFIPYAGTFMVFSDYAKHAVRLASLMNLKVVWVLTHDSYAVGEDGPTHQPVEHLAMLRSIPGCKVWRPCDSEECAASWKDALATQGPTCLSLSRQGVPFIDKQAGAPIEKGGYVLRDCEGVPQVILLATGSEVSLCVEAQARLAEEGIRVRVVSMPCCEVFDAQDAAYRESVLPDAVRARLAVEAGWPDYWRRYVGLDGDVLGLDHFGASAPGGVLAREFGFTADNVVERARALAR